MRSPLLVLILLVAETTLVQALASYAMLALPAIAPEISAGLNLPTTLVGVQISIAYGGAMLSALFSSNWVRRWGAIRTSQIALIICAAGTALLATGWLPAMILASVALGWGYGMINPAASHLLMRATSPQNRNLVFSIKQTGVPLGGTIAGVTLPPMALFMGWQVSFLLAASLSVMMAFALQLARKQWDDDTDPAAKLSKSPIHGLVDIWRERPLRYLSLAGFCFSMVQLALTTFAVSMLVKDLGWGLVQAGVLLAASQVLGMIGRIGSGSIADRWLGGAGTLALLGSGSGILCLCIYLLTPTSPLYLIWAVITLYGAFCLGWNGVYLAELARLAPAGKIPQVTGASLFFTYGGVLVGPTLFSAVAQVQGSYQLGYLLTLVPAFVGAFLFWQSGKGIGCRS